MKNLMKLSTQLLPLTTVSYSRFTSDTTNDVGLDVATYATAVPMKADVQAVTRSNYENLGLDFNKKYVTIFVMESLQDIDRDRSGDRFIYAGETFEIMSATDWYIQDGWTYYLAVRI